jgi:hypothetical protein
VPSHCIEIGRGLAFCIKLGLIVYLFTNFVGKWVIQKSQQNLTHFYRNELKLIAEGNGTQTPDTVRSILRREGFISLTWGKGKKNPVYSLTELGKKLLEEFTRNE